MPGTTAHPSGLVRQEVRAFKLFTTPLSSPYEVRQRKNQSSNRKQEVPYASLGALEEWNVSLDPQMPLGPSTHLIPDVEQVAISGLQFSPEGSAQLGEDLVASGIFI